jgi:NAD(P)-dependent dehydrogenase (short-subunit alcohol dehydrogenase family)
MAGEFEGKVVVVSGGSRGIGRAVAMAFAREGAQTVLGAPTAANLAEAAKAITAAGGKEPLTVAADLGTLEGCEQVFARVTEKFGRCDVLVNNAGATKAGAFTQLTEADWHNGFSLKFFGAVRLSRLFWPLLKESQGRIVNIVGGGARTPDAEFTIGGSVNAAMANFTKSLSRNGMRDGINVNAIHPGQTATERTEQLIRQRASALGKDVNEFRAASLAKSGTKRMAEPEEIAELALFLCSSRASHINGVAIAVDGGATPGVY